MPIYTYRREDGSRFDIKQSFHEAPLEICPDSGQPVVRIVQPVGIVFKGSGFYVNDSKAVKSANGAAKAKEETSGENGTSQAETKENQGETKSSEEKTTSEAKPAKQEASSATD